ncbi:electron transport complex subunit RsxD [Catenovulum sp. SM1970]|uniref:electron transport complex subunit RsxD n=1 Tax=Marinifaba aquimaris TaxID=2741323 RepID=UPI00157265F8|nr:electron transport complex subunit RsxD [Marinifaba aquimaris]NTS78454.1 electron transport complex subunit RsxD [Marinifaba aquimaris]
MSFKLASSPHTRKNNKTGNVMLQVGIACIPGIATQVYYFGMGVLIQILLCCLVAVLTEAICLKLRNRPIKHYLDDNSAVLSALLLAICLPPLAPWWVATIGTIFAIALVKHAFGGLGQNIFNPAMAGYVVLLISFPLSMTSWLPAASLIQYDLSITDTLYTIFTGYTTQGYSVSQLIADIDGFTMATPLDAVKTGITAGYTSDEILAGNLFDNGSGIGWMQVNIAYLLGGLYLLKTKFIKWQIPVSFIASLTFFCLLAQGVSTDTVAPVWIHLTSGATMLAAFFILTDPVSASTTNKGRLVYGALVGFFVFAIRTWGGYPDAVAFAVLLANMCVPLIDYYTQPRVYGHTEVNK